MLSHLTEIAVVNTVAKFVFRPEGQASKDQKTCHHIPQEEINPLLYVFAELNSFYSMFQSTTKILSLHDNVLKCTSSTQICSQPDFNIGHHCLQCKQYGLSQLH